MKPFPKIHDVYVGRVVLGTVALTWAVLGGLDVMLGLVSEFGDIGKGRYGISEAFVYMALSVPRRLYYLFPYAAVIGSLMALGQLAATSELTALRALGLSRRRLGLAVAGALALLTTLMVLNGERIAPWTQQRADMIKSAAKAGRVVQQYTQGLWARDGETILNAASGQERMVGDQRVLELQGVSLYFVAPDGSLREIIHAKSAQRRGGAWALRDVTRNQLAADSVKQEKLETMEWRSHLDQTMLTSGSDRPRYLSASDLRHAIDYRERNGLDASEFEEHYWGRWFYPVNVLALCLAAVPFAFGTLRSGGMGKRLFIGIVFALCFWLLQTQFVKLAAVYKFDYRLAYLLPTVIMLGVSGYLFKKRSG